ncbi:MAG TPA: RDD family protein [Candidatus Cybelea sp.]|nr:RDD family protein [Candidatus Cybelea sp.]
MTQAPANTLFACSQCGRMFADSDLVHIAGNWVCGDCKPTFLSRVMAGGPGVASSLSYAGVGIRFVARFIDGLVFLVPFVVIAILVLPGLVRTAGSIPTMFSGTFLLAGLTFSLFYEVLMLRYWGATLGKMACRLKVVRSDGGDLGWGVSFGRYFMYNVVICAVPLVNWILLLTTAIMAGVDPQKRGLHDRVCDTRVIDKRSAT